eukprot:350436-Chlamydomonas_euryale.AAC.2
MGWGMTAYRRLLFMRTEVNAFWRVIGRRREGQNGGGAGRRRMEGAVREALRNFCVSCDSTWGE